MNLLRKMIIQLRPELWFRRIINFLQSKRHVYGELFHLYNVIIAAVGVLLVCLILHKRHNLPLQYIPCPADYWSEELDVGFEGFDNVSGILHGPYIIPNYIHFLRYGEKLRNVNFMDAVNILAVFKNHKPDKIIFHTDLDSFGGKYWERLLKIPKFNETIEFQYIERVTSIFGQDLHSWYGLWHASDILRIHVLQKYGGIFIDNDVFVVQSLNRFRRFEMVLETIDDTMYGTMTLLAHKDARFLRLWLDSYKVYYPHLWYYNAGEKPKREVLDARPELVHDAKGNFGVEDLRKELYVQRWNKWRNKYTIHTLVRHLHDCEDLTKNTINLKYPVTFDEKNILRYNVTIQEMVLDCCKEFVFSV